MSELQYGESRNWKSNWKPQRSSKAKLMRLLRNKVTDAEIAEVLVRWTGFGFSHDGKRARKTAAYGARTAPSRHWSDRSG
ncbi:hypothetical protein ACNKHU_15850 [Shigella flexneri]